MKYENSGSVSLLIYGDALNFEEINRDMGVAPTCTMHKGDKPTKSLKEAVKQDFWEYSSKFDTYDDMQSAIENFADKLKKADLKKYVKYDVRFRIFLQSDMAQMFFSMPASFIKLAAESGCPVDISILSWGMVTDE